MNVRNDSKYLIILILFFLLFVGSFYTFFSYNYNPKKDNYSEKFECLKVNYSNLNENDNEKIVGILNPSINSRYGLSGMVSVGIDESCNIRATGLIYIHINSNISDMLFQNVEEHCENSLTLETIDKYNNSNLCTENNGIWVKDGVAFKYAVYNNDINGNPLQVGYITKENIDKDILIYENFDVSYMMSNYYVYIWIDGNLVNYKKLELDAYMYAKILKKDEY